MGSVFDVTVDGGLATDTDAAISGFISSDSGAVDWTQIASSSPTASTATFSFNSIPSYKYLRVISFNVPFAANSGMNITFNGSSASQYAYISTGNSSTTSTLNVSSAVTSTVLQTPSGGTTTTFDLFITNANNTLPKTINGWMATSGTSNVGTFKGLSTISAAITTLTIAAVGATTYSGTGTFYLLGGN